MAGRQPEIYLDLQRFGDEVIQLFQYDVILCVRLKICGLRKVSCSLFSVFPPEEKNRCFVIVEVLECFSIHRSLQLGNIVDSFL